MSRPRLLRTDTVDVVVGENLREAIDRLVRRPLERNARRAAFSGIRFTFDFTPREQLREPARVLAASR